VAGGVTFRVSKPGGERRAGRSEERSETDDAKGNGPRLPGMIKRGKKKRLGGAGKKNYSRGRPFFRREGRGPRSHPNHRQIAVRVGGRPQGEGRVAHLLSKLDLGNERRKPVRELNFNVKGGRGASASSLAGGRNFKTDGLD